MLPVAYPSLSLCDRSCGITERTPPVGFLFLPKLVPVPVLRHKGEPRHFLFIRIVAVVGSLGLYCRVSCWRFSSCSDLFSAIFSVDILPLSQGPFLFFPR